MISKLAVELLSEGIEEPAGVGHSSHEKFNSRVNCQDACFTFCPLKRLNYIHYYVSTERDLFSP